MLAKNAVGQGAFRHDTTVFDVDVDIGVGVGVVGPFARIIAIDAVALATATRQDGDVLRGDADFTIRTVSSWVIDYGSNAAGGAILACVSRAIRRDANALNVDGDIAVQALASNAGRSSSARLDTPALNVDGDIAAGIAFITQAEDAVTYGSTLRRSDVYVIQVDADVFVTVAYGYVWSVCAWEDFRGACGLRFATAEGEHSGQGNGNSDQ